MVIVSFLLSVTFSYTSSVALTEANLLASSAILVLFILIGVLFDIIGVAVTSANIATFHSMASRKVKGAKDGIWLIRNAERVASLCNDAIGDICGIMSGSTCALITAELISLFAQSRTLTVLLPLGVTGLAASLTIGGKALGKTVAVNQSDSVVFFVGRVLYYMKSFFGRRD